MAGDGYTKRWEVVGQLGDLGRGGQGTVTKVLDTQSSRPKVELTRDLVNVLKALTSPQQNLERLEEYHNFLNKVLREFVNRESTALYGALKILHHPDQARDSALANERLKREISSMQLCKHPNLIELFDANETEQWYVSRFYSGGTLVDNLDRYRGNVLKSLQAIRGLVAGVAKIHEAGMVHRDIKPHNIFIGSDDALVLGDFGLVYFEDSSHTRLSETIGNVGSRDWMPPWAMGMRIEELTPTFDVFSLGKVLWSMISGQRVLNLWYYDRPQFNLVTMFPESPSMLLANKIFQECVVQEHEHCLPSAADLLTEIDSRISQIERGGSVLRDNVVRHCRVCGTGRYELLVKGDGDSDTADNLGFSFGGGRHSFKVFACDYCGHVQQFKRTQENEPPAWIL